MACLPWITVLMLDLRPPEGATSAALLARWPDVDQLRRELSVHRHRVGEPSLPHALCDGGDAALDVGEFRAPVLGVAGDCTRLNSRIHGP
jgi:hypothetical protein